MAEQNRIAEMYKTRVEEVKLLLEQRTQRLEEKEELLDELRTTLGDRNSENTALTLMRCDKLQCSNRVPPFGFSKINIKGGQQMSIKFYVCEKCGNIIVKIKRLTVSVYV